MSPTFRALHNPNYRRYALGSLVSNTGTWMQRVAQDWLVLRLTDGSGTALGITTGLQFLPVLLLSPYAGVIADRFPKRRLLQLTQLTMALASLVLGVLAVTGGAQVWQVYVIAFLFGIGSAFDAPARQSFVSEMVGPDDLTNAVGLNSATFNTARIIGPALAGLMIGALGGGARATGWVILINALSYGAVIWQLAHMDASLLHSPKPVARTPGLLLEGVRYVRSQPKMMMILVMVFFAGTFGMNFQITSALMATAGLRQGRRRVRHPRLGDGGRLPGRRAARGATGPDPGPAAGRRRPRLRRRRDRRGPDADVRRVRADVPGDRPVHHHHAELRQRHHAAGVGPGSPRPGDGALHDHRDGRHARSARRSSGGSGSTSAPAGR